MDKTKSELPLIGKKHGKKSKKGKSNEKIKDLGKDKEKGINDELKRKRKKMNNNIEKLKIQLKKVDCQWLLMLFFLN